MTMILRTFTLTLASTRPIHGTSSELRGFFATKFTEYSLLHQHSADQLIYRYPLVQYKMIDGAPGINIIIYIKGNKNDNYGALKYE